MWWILVELVALIAPSVRTSSSKNRENYCRNCKSADPAAHCNLWNGTAAATKQSAIGARKPTVLVCIDEVKACPCVPYQRRAAIKASIDMCSTIRRWTMRRNRNDWCDKCRRCRPNCAMRSKHWSGMCAASSSYSIVRCKCFCSSSFSLVSVRCHQRPHAVRQFGGCCVLCPKSASANAK